LLNLFIEQSFTSLLLHKNTVIHLLIISNNTSTDLYLPSWTLFLYIGIFSWICNLGKDDYLRDLVPQRVWQFC